MLEVGGDLDLGQEPFGAEHGGQLGAKDLHRDLAVVLEILREVHRGHAALAQLALNAVAVTKGGGEAVGLETHRLASSTARRIRFTHPGITRR